MIALIYVDGMIVVSRKQNQIENIYNSLLHGDENFKLTKEGKIDNYLGVKLKDNPYGTFEASQPHLIKKIIDFTIDDSTKTNSRATPASLPLFHKDEKDPNKKYDWNYRRATGMLNYLTGSTRPDIVMAVHQITRFSNNPKLSHEKSIMRICQYLIGTTEKAMISKPDKTKRLRALCRC